MGGGGGGGVLNYLFIIIHGYHSLFGMWNNTLFQYVSKSLFNICMRFIRYSLYSIQSRYLK